MDKRTIGTCGHCGGAVTIPTIWHGITSPVPTCSGCGSVPVECHGPIITMKSQYFKVG